MQRRLMVVIRDDVDRLDRLISDISNASRLDAELGRDEAMSIDVGQMVATLVDFYSVSADSAEPHAPKVVCQPHEDKHDHHGGRGAFGTGVTKSDRQCAFVLAAGRVVNIAMDANDFRIRLVIDDNGQGIPENKLSAIFDRFYSERPKSEKFARIPALVSAFPSRLLKPIAAYLG